MFRLDADHHLGYGHLQRCLSLAEAWRQRGGDAAFTLACADPPACAMIDAQGWPWTLLTPLAPYGSEAALWQQDQMDQVDAVLLDIAHQRTFQQLDQIPAYVAALRKRFAKVILLDGLREHALAAQRRLELDLVIMPYPDADPLYPGSPGRRLAGPEYSIFPAALMHHVVRPRPVRTTGNRILVTCGGSDPTRLTLKYLEALDTILDRQLDIRVAVAAGFSPDLVQDIATRAAASPHPVEMLTAPKGLGDHMLWCDLTLAATGLTKYELALTGTPSIQCSINQSHHMVNASFAAQETAWNLGVQETLSPTRLAAAVGALLHDSEQRQAMSRKGQSLVDGRGTDRILDEMETLIRARS
ncbi:MAG: hypothetical protein HQL63_11225 [Magnetococcales bacterium]|nr:hypothetical protein [Magnetococcales bacterium]